MATIPHEDDSRRHVASVVDITQAGPVGSAMGVPVPVSADRRAGRP